MLVSLSLLKMGPITGQQAIMTPSKGSRNSRMAIGLYCYCVLDALRFLVILIRTIVMGYLIF